jgi:osmotically-inducible protein OsmY
MPYHKKVLTLIQKNDAGIKDAVYKSLWKDSVLRALEYYEIDVHVKNGIVYLDGYVLSATSQSRIENAIQDIPGILGVKNNLVLDDKLNLEVAASLGKLEHVYGCKFFTGASHGVLSLNGIVSTENVRSLAEQCVADNPNVRAVINNVRVPGFVLELQDQTFRQPVIGEVIYFLDGISGVLKQIIMNPNTRCAIAMTVQGKFTDQEQDLKSLNMGESQPPERLIVLRMSALHYLTRDSGFLNINSSDKNQYMEFDPNHFIAPDKNWIPPYPYCPDDVLFPIEYKKRKKKITQESHPTPIAVMAEDVSYRKQFVANDSFGGYDEK